MILPRRSPRVLATFGAALVCVASCADETPNDTALAPLEDVGRVGIALQVGNASVDSMKYVIASGAREYAGTIALSGASSVSPVIGGILAGAGYRLTVTGETAGDAGYTCSGSAGPFVVPVGSTATVAIAIRCTRPSTTGGVTIGGTVNVCPSIDSVSADPPVGGSIALHSTAFDLDHLPHPVSYAWTVSPGLITDPQLPDATLRCTQIGNVDVHLTVGDGDPECSDSLALQVVCTSASGPVVVAPNAARALPAVDAGVKLDAGAPVRDGAGAVVDARSDAGARSDAHDSDAPRDASPSDASPRDAGAVGDASAREAEASHDARLDDAQPAREANAAEVGRAESPEAGDAGGHDVARLPDSAALE